MDEIHSMGMDRIHSMGIDEIQGIEMDKIQGIEMDEIYGIEMNLPFPYLNRGTRSVCLLNRRWPVGNRDVKSGP